METYTIVTATTLVSFIMLMTMAMLFAVSRSEKYMFDWLMAGLFFFSSSALASIKINFDLPSLIHPALGNALYIAGHAALFSGVSKLLFGRSQWKWVLTLSAGAVCAHYIPGLLESVDARVLLFYPVIVALDTTALIALFKQRQSEQGKAYYPLIFVLLIFVFQILFRGAVLLIGEEVLTPFGNEVFQTTGGMAVICFYFMITMSSAVVVFWRKELVLRQTAITDHLTGWLNRKTLSKLAYNALCESKRLGNRVGFIVFDIDHFKSINDTFGHHAGDSVIQQVCEIAASHIRDYDLGFRLGGEEFLIIAKQANVPLLETMANRIRKAIEQHEFRHENASMSVSISAGIAIHQGDDMSWETLLEQADNAMYRSKQKGRNQVNFFSPNEIKLISPVNK